MPVPHPFARHVVAGEDALAPDLLLSFSPETHDPRAPLPLTDYVMHVVTHGLLETNRVQCSDEYAP